ncbi:MAG TPA: hypothetical protein VLA43_19640, partial [Longimicrobiales bacterium]|nr:hypothetical protein [Longimicrobiales bacterium]
LSLGLPQDDYAKVIRQHPANPSLLFLGMDRGLYASLDRGRTWADIRNNLPRVSVRGIKIQPQYNDLIIGTHGVGAWILDNVQPLVELADAMGREVHLFDVRTATDWESWDRDSNLGRSTFEGENPREGAYIDFYLAEAPGRGSGGVSVRISDAQGRLVRELSDVRAAAGVNRVVWNLTWQGAEPVPGDGGGGFGGRGGGSGPPVVPGTYTATLSAGGQELSKSFQVRGDPEVTSTQADYQARTDAALGGRDLESRLNGLIGTVMDLQAQVETLRETIQGKDLPNQAQVTAGIGASLEALGALDNDLRRPPPRMGYRQYPRLSEQLGFVTRGIAQAQARPTEGQIQVLGEVEEGIREAEGRLRSIVNGPVAELNRLLEGQARILVGGSGE